MIKNYITVDGHRYKLVGEEDVEDNEDIFAVVGDSWEAIHFKGRINGSKAVISVCDDDTSDIREMGWSLTADAIRELILFLEEVIDKVDEENDDE